MKEHGKRNEIHLSKHVTDLREWYEAEFDGLRTFRWSGEVSTIRIDMEPAYKYLILALGTPDTGEARRVTIRGTSAHTIELYSGWHRYALPLDEILDRSGDVRIETTPGFRPDGDSRTLGVMVSSIVLSEEEEEALFPYVARTYSCNDTEITLRDHVGSCGAENSVTGLIKDVYKLNSVEFEPDDVVLDIGAHVGAVSIYLAKKYPFVRVYAFEPVQANYYMLRRNIEANGLKNVFAYNLAVTGDRREIEISVHLESNTAGATTYLKNLDLPSHQRFTANSITLDDIFESFLLNRCRALVMDCEGCEHEAIPHSTCLDKVDHLGIEIHENDCMKSKGFSAEKLKGQIFKHFSDDRVGMIIKRMSG